MSFVLEALKKQEAGGDPDAAVSLARETTARHRHRLWVGLFAAAMTVNVAVLFWLFGLPLLRPGDAPAEPGLTTPARPSASTPTPAEPTANPSAEDPAPVAPAAAATGEPAAPPRAAPQPAPRPISVALEDLPADARARFPGLAFSTHVYAEDADLRAIVANGQRLQEGDRIRGLEILEITETGVVLRFERYRVTVPIVTDW